jgi:hydroxymethylbilane synthase
MLRLGTRKSPMALAQSGLVAQAITERTGCRVELTGVTTHGDISKAHLAQMGGTGVFVSALRDRLLGGEVDVSAQRTCAGWCRGGDGVAGDSPGPSGSG